MITQQKLNEVRATVALLQHIQMQKQAAGAAAAAIPVGAMLKELVKFNFTAGKELINYATTAGKWVLPPLLALPVVAGVGMGAGLSKLTGPTAEEADQAQQLLMESAAESSLISLKRQAEAQKALAKKKETGKPKKTLRI